MMRSFDAKACGEHSKIKTHFARIIVGNEAENPYYSILYYDPADDEYHQGFGSSCLEYVFKWLSEEFEIVGDAFFCEPVRHGRWIVQKVDDIRTKFYCSECERCVVCVNDFFMKPTEYVAHVYPYCHCGAKMDGGAA